MGSEKAVYAFLKKEFDRTNRAAFGGNLEMPELQIRPTFAVELLLAGVPTERVAMLLGNTPRIVEKHYSTWIQARQDQLEDDVKKTW